MIDTLNVPVELLGVDDYRSLFIDAGSQTFATSACSTQHPFRKIILAARSEPRGFRGLQRGRLLNDERRG